MNGLTRVYLFIVRLSSRGDDGGRGRSTIMSWRSDNVQLSWPGLVPWLRSTTRTQGAVRLLAGSPSIGQTAVAFARLASIRTLDSGAYRERT
jgi:hypothetical protein